MATKDMQKELEEKMKIPKELKEKQNKIGMENFGFAIFTSIYFLFLNLGFHNIVKHIFIEDTKVFSGIILAIALILFERAFKKENGSIALHGIELLILAIITLFVPYIYYVNTDITNIIMVVLIAGFNIYYLSKVAIICAKMEQNYRTSLSDVKNIIKKEKRKLEEISEEELEKTIVESKKTEEKVEKTKTATRQRKKTEQPKQTTNKQTTKTKQAKTSDKPAKKSVAKTKQDTEEKPKTTRKRTTKKKEEEK